MSSAAPTIVPARTFRLRQVALPTEHGAWGFLLEPLVAALVIAFSSGGIWISIMVIGAFLARRPLQVFIKQRNTPAGEMKAAALKFFGVFSLFAAIGLVGALVTSSLAVLIPLATALPVAVFQLYIESTTRGRHLVAELAGALVMPASAASIILAGGGGWPFATAVWFLFAARFVPSILYIRNRLNLEKGKASSMFLPALAHVAALIPVSLIAFTGYLPMLVIPAFALLLARSIYGLSRYRKRVKAMKIGVSEVVYGLVVVASLIIGHLFSL
ncbi:MAG: YwiC-like family protein [Pyrinomonadaceae bacterium]